MTTARRDFLKHAGLGASALVALPGSALAATSPSEIASTDAAAQRALQRLNAAEVSS